MNITKDLSFQQAIEKRNDLLNRKRTVIHLLVDPVERSIQITHLVNNCTHEINRFFADIDEWVSFETDCLYDIHFYYVDGILDVSVYQVIDNEVDYETPIKTKITLKKIKLALK